MSYALRKDGLGWRAINSPADVTADETLSSTQPVLEISPEPDVNGFIQAVKIGLGGIVAANGLATIYPLFFPAVQSQNWADTQALLNDALSKSVITSTQKTAILAAATAFNITGLS